MTTTYSFLDRVFGDKETALTQARILKNTLQAEIHVAKKGGTNIDIKELIPQLVEVKEFIKSHS